MSKLITKKEAIALFRDTIANKSDEIDPNDEIDWNDMALGFFLALGFPIEEVNDWNFLSDMTCANFDKYLRED